MDLGQFQQAATLLESLLKKKSEQDDPFVYNALAKALYSIGKQSKNIDILKNAHSHLVRAKEIFPEDLSTQFNGALLEQQYALLLTDQPLEKRSVIAMKEAITKVEDTKEIFTQLSNIPGKTSTPFIQQQSKNRADFVNTVVRLLQKKIHETETLDRIKSERLEEMKIARDLAELEKQEKLAIQKEQERLEQEEIERKRLELKALMAVENEKMKSYTEKKTPKKTKQDSSDESSGPVVKRRKKSKLKEEDSKEEVNNSDIVKGKSSILSKSIIESDDDINDNVDETSLGENDGVMQDVKKTRTITESDDD